MATRQTSDVVEQGSVHHVRVDAKGARDEGIARVGDFVVFIKNSRTRIGNQYNVKVTKVYRTFAYAEVEGSPRSFIGNGSLVEYG